MVSIQTGANLEPGTSSSFGRRCVSALVHQVTIAAIVVLLTNDLVLKSLWPDSWVTGKLSDLAWVVFALPLLAFLLSLITRGNRLAESMAFLTAYIGLPILYAAYNTFEPVHRWVLRGISLASGGTAGSPLDVTDSIVIPLGLGIAVWVWQRGGRAGILKSRWSLLIAGIAAVASVASSQIPTDEGITALGIDSEGTVHAGQPHFSHFRSLDGGTTWIAPRDGLDRWEDIELGGVIAETTKGRYEISEADIVVLRPDGVSEVAYSTAYLENEPNVWVQKQATTQLSPRKIAARPSSIVYHEGSGNLIAAVGIQGVVVGSPDGKWARHAVGPYLPTDFSFFGKTTRLLSRLGLWATAVALSLSMTGSALIYAQSKRKEGKAPGCLLSIASLIASGLFILMYSGSDGVIDIFGLMIIIVGLAAIVLGIAVVGAFWSERNWGITVAAFVGMIALIILSFMFWLQLDAPFGAGAVTAIILTALSAVVLAEHIKLKQPPEQ